MTATAIKRKEDTTALNQAISEFQILIKQQLNLTLLGFACLSCYLTGNFNILRIALVLETWYLLLGYLLLNLKNQFLPNATGWILGAKLARLRSVKWQVVCSWLVLAGGIYFVILKYQPITIGGHSFQTQYERWEIAALAWNVVFATVSLLSMPGFTKPWRQKFALLLLFVAGWWCTKQGLESLAHQDHRGHLGWVLCIAACYVFIDIIICIEFWKRRHRRRLCLETMFYADLPTVGALSGLLLFWRENPNAQNMSIFSCGAIAFQFIASSLVFVFIESRLSEVLFHAQPVRRNSKTTHDKRSAKKRVQSPKNLQESNSEQFAPTREELPAAAKVAAAVAGTTNRGTATASQLEEFQNESLRGPK